MLSLMLSCHLLEILNFLTSGPAFSFCMEPCKLGNLPLTYILGDRNEEEIGSLFCLERGNEMPRIIPWERFENLAPVPLTQATQYFLWPQGHLPDLDVQDLMIDLGFPTASAPPSDLGLSYPSKKHNNRSSLQRALPVKARSHMPLSLTMTAWELRRDGSILTFRQRQAQREAGSAWAPRLQREALPLPEHQPFLPALPPG